MARTPLSPKELINTRGGPHTFARKVRRKPGAVRMWVARNVLPRSAWPEIIEAFPDLTIDDLKRIEAAA